jgi:hypothetical protein
MKLEDLLQRSPQSDTGPNPEPFDSSQHLRRSINRKKREMYGLKFRDECFTVMKQLPESAAYATGQKKKNQSDFSMFSDNFDAELLLLF